MTTDPNAGTPPAGGAAPASSFDWAGALGQDFDAHKAVIEGDKLTDPKAALSAYATLKQQASSALTVPGENATQSEWDAFHAKIGRPEKAEGYQFAKPEGLEGYSDTMASWFRGAAHKAGLTGKQAAAMHDAWVEMFKGNAQASATEAANQEKALSEEMAKTWGSAKDKNIELARRGAKAFGFDADMLDGLEGKIGSFKMLDAFAKIGAAIGEDSIHGGTPSGGGANPWAKDTFNLTTQAKIMREDPQMAARLMAQAGVKPPSA